MAEFLVLNLAEAFVSQAIQRIDDLLTHEADSLSSVKNDVENLGTELTRIKCFLEDASNKQKQDKRVRNWVAEVRDLACEIEDAIDTYIYKVHSSCVLKGGFHLIKLRKRINSIKDKLRSISESRQRYQIQFSSGEVFDSLRNLRRSYPDDDEEDGHVISMESTMAALKAQLMKEEDRRCVVSIVGMGGLGKTTLAKKVYKDVDVMKQFDCHAWVFVSQKYVLREVLSEILMQVGFQAEQERILRKEIIPIKELLEERRNRREILKGLEDHDLIESIKDELRDQRYLIVLDDVWSIEAWSTIQSAFPIGKPGSKILFTTRIERVAFSADPQSSAIKPPLLTPEESWELLKRKAIPSKALSESGGYPSEFEELGKEMVDKCGGLPLAIVVLAGLLRTKINSSQQLEKLKKDVKTLIINNLKSEQQYRVEDILELSFQDLPYYLKPCFLYLGIFPEETDIPKRKVIRLWIAEGFVPILGGEVQAENIAEQYLGELIDRCMVQVGKRDHTGKGVKTCQLHDLFRDFCTSKSKEEVFFGIMKQNNMNMMVPRSSVHHYSPTTHAHRVTIHVNHGWDCSAPSMQQVHPHLRSLLCFGMHTLPFLSLRKKSLMLLRVLELDFIRGRFTDTKLLRGIGNLVHLRYMRICGIEKKWRLPNSIGNLTKLHTLDLGDNSEVFLPRTLSRLINLRYLSLPCSTRACSIVRSPLFGNNCLRNIEKLKGVNARDLIRNGAVLPLPNILKLEIRMFRRDKDVGLVLKSISSRLGHLRSLCIELNECDFSDLQLLSHCYDLTKLGLFGGLSQQNFSFIPKSLTKLELAYFLLNQDKFAVLEKLPNLRILQLRSDYLSYDTEDRSHYEGYKLVCSAGGFPKLEILKLRRLQGLEEWEVEESAMTNLKRLDIERIPKLWMMPEGLKYVTTLCELNICSMWKVFENRLKVEDGIEGEDFHKVQHIPSISFSHTWWEYMAYE
uniref:Disease resistance protein RGA2 n=1 Tax=Morus macroura TaxID=191188 RepID=A0AA49K7H3_9ROSA|nr:disease resistance protein RGA2 [Morus macroura]